MEGLIPFVIDAIRKSHERGGSYRCVSSDGSSHGSRRHLIDYWELPAGAAAAPADVVDGSSSSSSAMLHRRARSEFVQATTDVRRAEEHARPATIVAGSAYRRK